MLLIPALLIPAQRRRGNRGEGGRGEERRGERRKRRERRNNPQRNAAQPRFVLKNVAIVQIPPKNSPRPPCNRHHPPVPREPGSTPPPASPAQYPLGPLGLNRCRIRLVPSECCGGLYGVADIRDDMPTPSEEFQMVPFSILSQLSTCHSTFSSSSVLRPISSDSAEFNGSVAFMVVGSAMHGEHRCQHSSRSLFILVTKCTQLLCGFGPSHLAYGATRGTLYAIFWAGSRQAAHASFIMLVTLVPFTPPNSLWAYNMLRIIIPRSPRRREGSEPPCHPPRCSNLRIALQPSVRSNWTPHLCACCFPWSYGMRLAVGLQYVTIHHI